MIPPKLKTLRKRIDSCDEALFEALFRRLDFVKEIGEVKKELKLEPLDPDRLFEMIMKYRKLASDKGYNPKLGEAIINTIHDYSSKIVNDKVKS